MVDSLSSAAKILVLLSHLLELAGADIKFWNFLRNAVVRM